MKKMMFILISFLLLFPLSVKALVDTASNSIVMDINSGRILYQKESDSRHLIASITKIMTAVVALDNGKLHDTYTAGEEVLAMYGSNIYLEYKEKMMLEDLLYGLMLRSGNDAAVVIANHVAKDEKAFVQLMNKKARQIGMKNTTFVNCHGLDEKTQNYSTAHDMAILSRYAYQNYPMYRKITGTYKYVSKSKKKTYLWYNRNKLLKMYDKATGGKTGFTPSAGKTFVSTARSQGLELTIVTLNDSDTYSNHKRLYEEYYAKYRQYLIVDHKNFDLDENYIIKESFSYPLTAEEKNSIRTLIRLDKSLSGAKKGSVEVYLDDELIKKIPVYEAKKKEKKSHPFSSFFKQLFS